MTTGEFNKKTKEYEIVPANEVSKSALESLKYLSPQSVKEALQYLDEDTKKSLTVKTILGLESDPS